jgi:hypothetical protein
MKIKTIKDLRSEKARLKMEVAEAESRIKEDFDWMLQELKPINAITKGISNIFNSRDNGIVGDTVGASVAFVMSKLLLRNSNWLFKIILPQIAKNFSSNIFADKKVDLLSLLKGFIHKIRKDKFKSNGIYDRSTAQSSY